MAALMSFGISISQLPEKFRHERTAFGFEYAAHNLRGVPETFHKQIEHAAAGAALLLFRAVNYL